MSCKKLGEYSETALTYEAILTNLDPYKSKAMSKKIVLKIQQCLNQFHLKDKVLKTEIHNL